MTRKTLLTIDPGENTGWAYFGDDIIPEATGCWKSKEYNILQNEFRCLLKKHIPDIVVMEDVQQMGIKTLAGGKRVNKLNRIIGLYINECNTLKIKWKLVTPIKWKGTLKNKILRKWIIEIIGNDYHPVHTLCAVGIGLNERGLI